MLRLHLCHGVLIHVSMIRVSVIAASCNGSRCDIRPGAVANSAPRALRLPASKLSTSAGFDLRNLHFGLVVRLRALFEGGTQRIENRGAVRQRL